MGRGRVEGSQSRGAEGGAGEHEETSSTSSDGDSNAPAALDASEAQREVWEARRRAWLQPQEATSSSSAGPTLTSSAPARPPRAHAQGLLPRFTGHPHPGRQRLEQLLSVDNAEADEGIWSSIRQVWQRLYAGTQLTTPLPLGMVIRILRGGWIRDGTWPLTADGPAAVAEEEGEETNGNGGHGHGHAAALGQGLAEQLVPVAEEPMEEEGTPTTATEVSEGTVLSGREFEGAGEGGGRRSGEW